MNVLSLCDGMSCGQIALNELGVNVENYYSSEIDKVAINTTLLNFPNTIQLGNVININLQKLQELPKIDLVIFGFPCRSLSKANINRKEYNNGLNGISGLFYPCNNILQWIKNNNNSNVLFMVENVESNNKIDLDIISNELQCKPIMINSNLFSAQDRKRNYWTNIKIDKLPTINNINLVDIMDKNVDSKFYYDCDFDFWGEDKKICAKLHINGHDILKRVNSKYFKCPTLTACRGGNTQKKVYDNNKCRKLTPNEYRKLQNIPEWYKMNVANSHIYNMCGDGWNIETIKFIFKNINS